MKAPKGEFFNDINDWWGKKDSNLRSHKTADLQSAPFATRDTPPLHAIDLDPPGSGFAVMDDAKTNAR
jgi:hypothetical protein